MAELIDLTQLQAVLQEYADEAVEMYRYQISLGGKNASRELFNSVKTRVVVNDKEYVVEMDLAKYYKYIEGGSKGTETSPPGAVYPAHRPPASVILQWISIKPVIPRPDDAGKIPSPESLAYAIRRSIEKRGIAPYPALEQTKKELLDIYRERISAALGHDVEHYIAKVLR